MKSIMKRLAMMVMCVALCLACVLVVSAAAYPESSHNYSNYADQTWTYNHATTVDALKITFSSDTYVESNYDYIYVYTLDGTQVGVYTGSQLAGKTVNVSGSGFKVRLTSDGSSTYYGFRITNVQGIVLERLENCTVTMPSQTYTYTGQTQTPSVSVYDGGVRLYEDVDYTVEYSNNVQAGMATVTLSGIGDYCGTVTRNFEILSCSAGMVEMGYPSDQTYTGSAIQPEFSLWLNDALLPSDHYTVTYTDNVQPGTATATITSINFPDVLVCNFTIVPCEIPESTHYYTGYVSNSWTYVNHQGGDYQVIKFSPYTGVTSSYYNSYYIYISDLSGNGIGNNNGYYYGSSLAGEEVIVPGKGFKIEMYDYSSYGSSYGFSIDSITPKNFINLSSCTISLSKTSVTYNGTAQTPSVTVKNGTQTLTKDTDYSVSYSSNKSAGTAKVTVTGKGIYSGKVTKTFTIKKASLSSASVSVSNVRWTGKALKPSVTVKIGSKTLSSSHYTLTYKNNTKVGTASVTVKAKGSNTTGSKTVTFKILAPAYPESTHPVGSYVDQTWTYKYYEDVDYLKIKFNSKTKVESYWYGSDYIYIYTSSGKLVGEYTGTELAGKTITVKGRGFKIRLTTSYKASYDDFYGFKIDKVTGYDYVSMSKCKITLSKTSVTYDGDKQTPSVKVKYGSKTLKKDTDYTVSYSNNTKAGTAKVTIKGKGNYTGSVTKKFTIKKLSLSKVSVSKISSQDYTGKAIKPTVKVKYSGETISSSNYKVTYKNNKEVGTATITIKAKGSNTTGSKKITFKIVPKLNYEKKNMYKGKSFTLKLEGVSLSQVKFTTSDKSICKVSSKGEVKAVKVGSATITATYKGETYKCKVKVLETASTSSSTAYYKSHDDVPDFGALMKIDPTTTETSSSTGDKFTYSLSDLQKVDPDQESGDKYKKLLVKCNFELKGTTKIDGKTYYKYVSEKKIVYFGIASKNGEVKIIIKLK